LNDQKPGKIVIDLPVTLKNIIQALKKKMFRNNYLIFEYETKPINK